MSEPEAQHEISAGAPGGQDRPPGQEPPRGKKPGSSRGILIGIAGGLVIAGIAAIVVLPGIRGDKPAAVGEESTLEVLIPADINAALPTLDPGTSKAAVDDAKNCKVPLAWVTLTQRPGGHGGMVRVRSGSYQSPPIKLTPAPQRVAVPYPAPYPDGPWSSYIGRRGGPGGVLPDARGRSRRERHVFRQREVAGSQPLPMTLPKNAQMGERDAVIGNCRQ